jgi:hypothetical protein
MCRILRDVGPVRIQSEYLPECSATIASTHNKASLSKLHKIISFPPLTQRLVVSTATGRRLPTGAKACVVRTTTVMARHTARPCGMLLRLCRPLNLIYALSVRMIVYFTDNTEKKHKEWMLVNFVLWFQLSITLKMLWEVLVAD